jgi:hypothetical protein
MSELCGLSRRCDAPYDVRLRVRVLGVLSGTPHSTGWAGVPYVGAIRWLGMNS